MAEEYKHNETAVAGNATHGTRESDEKVNLQEEQSPAPDLEISNWEPSAPPEDGSPPDYYTAIKQPEYTTDIPPPPEYTPPSVQGLQTGQTDGSTVARLAYVDFLPRCLRAGSVHQRPVFDNFKSLLGFANQWIRDNPLYRVIRCESITRKIKKDGVIEIDSTSYHQSLYGDNDYIRGLRLWLILSPAEQYKEPQQLAYLNIVPKDLPPTQIPLYMRIGGRHHGGMMIAMGGVSSNGTPVAMVAGPMYVASYLTFPDFEDTQKTCERFNCWVRQYPLPGKMLSLESLDMIHSEAWKSRCLDPDEGFFRDKGKSSKLYLTVLRLFYVLGQPHHEEIGIEDFNPETLFLSESVGAKPRYEKYTTVLQRARTWIYNQNLKEFRLMNVNTVDTKVDANQFRRPSDRFRADSNRSFYNDPSFSSLTFVKTIRVCYVKQAKPPKMPQELPPITLTSKCIVAARLGGNNLTESLSSLVQRVNAWINATGVTLVGVDTVKYEYDKTTSRPVDDEKTDFTVQSNRGHYWIVGLRLYLNGLYQEPPPEMLPPPPERIKSSGCFIL